MSVKHSDDNDESQPQSIKKETHQNVSLNTKIYGLDEEKEEKKYDNNDNKMVSKMQLLHNNEPILFDIGGTKYKTTLSTLSKYNDSILYKMFEGKFSLKAGKDGSYFIDRNGSVFKYILDYLRDGVLLIPTTDRQYILHKLLSEADFYNLPSLNAHIFAYKIEAQSQILQRNDILQIQQWINDEYPKEIRSKNPNWKLLYKAYDGKTIAENPNLTACKGSDSLLYVFVEQDKFEQRFGIYSKALFEAKVDNADNFTFVLESDVERNPIKSKAENTNISKNWTQKIGYNMKVRTRYGSGSGSAVMYPFGIKHPHIDNKDTVMYINFNIDPWDKSYNGFQVIIATDSGYTTNNVFPVLNLLQPHKIIRIKQIEIFHVV